VSKRIYSGQNIQSSGTIAKVTFYLNYAIF